MTRVQIALLLALIGSSLFLVKTSYETRRLFAANQKAEAEGLRIEQEFKRLEAQRQLNATNPRVAREAQTQLRMKIPVQKFEVFESAPRPGEPATLRGDLSSPAKPDLLRSAASGSGRP